MKRRRRGNMILECILFLPILFLLIGGMVQFGRLTYTYYTLKKTLETVARFAATQPGINFCDPTGDAIVQAGINLAVTGTADASADPQIANLTPDLIQVSIECVDASGATGTCDTSGCDGAGGAPRPDFVVVNLPNGFEYPLRIPYILTEPVLLRPSLRVPAGGG